MSPGDRMAKGLEFMLKGIGPKDKTSKAEGEPRESGVMTPESVEEGRPATSPQHPESGVKSHDSRVGKYCI
jgi:hypothetical protein